MDNFGTPVTVSAAGMGGEAMPDGSAASNGGSDPSSREVLVGEIVAGDAVSSRPTNGSAGPGESTGEGRDTPPLP